MTIDKTAIRNAATVIVLRDRDGADVLVMGCAGMARYRERLADRLGIPVVDPTQAAVGMAITAIRLAAGPRAAAG